MSTATASRYAGLTDADKVALKTRLEAHLEVLSWRYKARPKQLPPWNPLAKFTAPTYLDPETGVPTMLTGFLVTGGRGSGKTWTGANCAAELAVLLGGTDANGEQIVGMVIAPTLKAARKVCIEGSSGLLRALGGIGGPHIESYNRTDGFIYLRNGGLIVIGTAEDGAVRAQGYNLTWVWADEVGMWNLNQWETAWDESLGHAVRKDPALWIATGTPKQGHPLVQQIQDDPSFHCVRMSTRENMANLSAKVVDKLYKKHQGSRMGEQELEGRVLADIPGALWTMALLEAHALYTKDAEKATGGQYRLVCVGWDPAVSDSTKSDEHGIVVVGLGYDDHLYILEDVSGVYGPDGAARVVAAAYDRWEADSIVVEVNNGGDWIASHVRNTVGARYNVRSVHAKKNKKRRAEPIVGYTEQGKVHLVGKSSGKHTSPLTSFVKLVEQMTQWTEQSSKSPDRMDAAVWACTHLLAKVGGGGFTLKTVGTPKRPRR